MNKATQIVPDVWFFQGEEGQWNCGVIHDEKDVLLVDPGLLGDNLSELESFLRDTGRQVVAIVQTHVLAGGMPGPEMWPEAARISPDTAAKGMKVPFLPGWQVVIMPGRRRVGVYGVYERILFSGDMLCDPSSVLPIPMLAGGAEDYLEALESIEKMDVKMVVPTAGAPARGKRGIRDRVERDRNYTTSVIRHVGTTMASGVPLQTAIIAARSTYSEYPFVEAHIDNMRAVWEEIEGPRG